MKIKSFKFQVLRRLTQISILLLFFLANVYGINILVGSLSASTFLGVVPFADPFAVLQIFFAGSFVGGKILIGALISLILYGVFFGRVFCSWVCPVNMITDLANYLRRKLYLDKSERKVWLSRNIRYWAIGLVLILSFLNGVAAFEFVSPIAMFHRGVVYGMGMGFSALSAIFLIDLFGIKNGWCGHFCPLGAFYSLISKYSLFRVRHIKDNCTGCFECKLICPEVQVLKIISKQDGSINSGECINCLRCIEVCNDKALIFGLRNLKSFSKV